MKTKLIYILLLIYSINYAQTLPSGHYGEFEFTNGSLANTSSSGGALSGSIVQGEDRYYNNNRAVERIDGTGILNGFNLGAANINEITIGFWIKSANFADGAVRRLIQIYGNNGDGFRLELDNDDLLLSTQFTTNSTVFPPVYTEAINLTNSRWRHIALRTTHNTVNESLIVDIFVDGVLQNNISTEINPAGVNPITRFIENGQLVISPLAQYIAGSIDDLYIYKSALTNQEILDMYNSNPTAGIAELTRIYVNESATGSNNGSSWTNAFTSLQSAITQATDGDEIWIAGGTYKPSSAERNKYFTVNKPNLKIYGGFAGTETQVSDRILGANETILSGDVAGDDNNIATFADNYFNTTRNNDNTYRIILITAFGNDLLLDGLTISDAHNNANAGTIGAAIHKNKTISKLTVKNCIIKDNLCRNGNAGISVEFELNNNGSGTPGELSIENCKFINNMARWATGVYTVVRQGTAVNINVENTLFDGNISADINASVTGLSGSASWYRGLSYGTTINLTLTNNTYVNNIDLGTGQSLDNTTRATVGISRSHAATNFAATVANCIFWNNTTSGGATTRSITDLYEANVTPLNVRNSIDPLSFNDSSVASRIANSNLDPLFANINNDYTLQASSPAIDAGGNGYVTTSSDLLGNQRIFNNRVDMGAYEFGSSPLGIYDFQLNEDNIKLHPNPSTSILNIEMEDNLKQATVYSVLGAEVIKTTTKSISTSNLKNGIYLLKVEDENGNVSTKRFIKR